MAAFSKVILSGSVNGRGIPITGISPSTANTIHTSVTGANDFDEVYVYAVNTQAGDSEITIVWGVTVAGATTAGVTERQIPLTVTGRAGPVLITPGWPLNDKNLVEAFATAAGRIVIYGYAQKRVS